MHTGTGGTGNRYTCHLMSGPLPPARSALALGVVCVGLFLTPAFLVSRGWTVAGDKQKEACADIAAISPQTVQHNVRKH